MEIFFLLGRPNKSNLLREVNLINYLISYVPIHVFFFGSEKNSRLGYDIFAVEKIKNSLSTDDCNEIHDIEDFFEYLKAARPKLLCCSDNQFFRKNSKKIKSLGIRSIRFSADPTLDDINHGEDLTLVPNDLLLSINKKTGSLKGIFRRPNVKKSGCISMCGYEHEVKQLDYIRKKYALDSKKICMFFIKDVRDIEIKIGTWFKFKSKSWRKNYINNLQLLYSEIIEQLLSLNYKVCMTRHPRSAFDKLSDERITWIDQEDKYSLILYSDFGVAVTSSMAIEYSHLEKPMLYVASHSVIKPNYSTWDFVSHIPNNTLIVRCGNGKIANPWCPVWVGEYAESPSEMHNKIQSLCKAEYNYKEVFDFYWGGYDCNHVFENIKNEILKF